MTRITVGVKIWNFVNNLQVPLRRQDFQDGRVRLDAPLSVAILARQKKEETGGIDFVDLSASLLKIELSDRIVSRDSRLDDVTPPVDNRGDETTYNTVGFRRIIEAATFLPRMVRRYGDAVGDHLVDIDVSILSRMFNALDKAGRSLLFDSIDQKDVLVFMSYARLSPSANEQVNGFLTEIGY